MNRLESWLVNLTGEHYLWVFELFVIVLIALSLGFVLNRMLDKLEVQAAKTKTVWDDALIEACRRPAIWLIWILGINFAAGIAAQKMDSPLQAMIDPINRLALIFLGTIFLTNFIKRAERNLVHPEYMAQPMDATTVRAVGKLLRASVIITGVLIAMQLFGYSISGLLAFGGIGGIAVGFAAKDLLANFFGGLMIYLDRPFSVGEWIRSPDKEIEGTVEDIGSMDAIVTQVTAMLMAHPEIDTNQTMIVNFNKFSASSVDFFVYTFTKTTNWVDFHQIKQDVLLKVAEIVAANSAEIAFPTSTLHIASEEQFDHGSQ